MRALVGQQVLMRIFIGETDRHGSRPLYKALVELFRRERLAGATVLTAAVPRRLVPGPSASPSPLR